MSTKQVLYLAGHLAVDIFKQKTERHFWPKENHIEL